MGRPRPVAPVKLVCGLLGGDADLLRRARHLLVRRFGPVDIESPLWPFGATDYYEAEMGADLKRCFLSFERLVRPDTLAGIKVRTNGIERQMAEEVAPLDVSRPVNLDPGYVHPGKLVLASTKDASHRVCLGERIHAEVTLRFADGAWRALDWTYADYRQPEYHAFFDEVRQRLLEQQRDEADADGAGL